MAFTYDPTQFPQLEIDVHDPKSTSKKPRHFSIPMLGYVSKVIYEAADEALTERWKVVQAERDRRNEAREAMPDSDAAIQYPTQLDVMDEVLGRVDVTLAAIVAEWPVEPRKQLWKQWQEESAPADVEKSDASSDSSAASE